MSLAAVLALQQQNAAAVLFLMAGCLLTFWPRRPDHSEIDDEYRGMGRDRPTPNTIDEAEALTQLGLRAGASDSDIVAAYHRKMKAEHPDRGGSASRAAQLNAARDLLSRSPNRRLR